MAAAFQNMQFVGLYARLMMTTALGCNEIVAAYENQRRQEFAQSLPHFLISVRSRHVEPCRRGDFVKVQPRPPVAPNLGVEEVEVEDIS